MFGFGRIVEPGRERGTGQAIDRIDGDLQSLSQCLGILTLEHGFEILEPFLGNEFLENIKASIEVLMLDGDTGLSDGVESFGIWTEEIHSNN